MDIANYDYTASIPPIEGTLSDDEYWGEEEPGCECEIDWKCGVCRENGYRHERLDAAGLGPDVDMESARWEFGMRRLELLDEYALTGAV
jgi:hypothetical protein